MPFRGLLAGIAVLAVLAGLVWWSEKKGGEKSEKSATDAPKLVSLKDDEVQRIEIVHKDQPATLLEKDNSGWQIKHPKPMRVDSDAVSSLVSTFTGLNWDRLVEEKAPDLSTFGLQQPALKVTVNGKQSVLVGDETPTGGGFFAKLEGDPRVFSIHSGTKSSLDKTWKDLQDKRLLTFDESKLTRVELAAKGQKAEFGKNAQNEWQITLPRPMRADNWAVEEVVRKLKDAKIDTSVSDDEAKGFAGKFAGGARIASVNVTDASGTQTLEVRKNGDDYFARSSVVEGFHKVANDVGEGLNKGLEDFRNKKLFDFGFNEPSKVDVIEGDKAYHLVKGGEKWWQNGKEMDSASVQSLIDKLRELTATGFSEGGMPSAPAMTITVASNDGKRTERVLLAKSGENWLAQRENEPTVYRLDTKAVEEIGKAAADVKAPPPPEQTKSGGGK
jgi:hypothetical protein